MSNAKGFGIASVVSVKAKGKVMINSRKINQHIARLARKKRQRRNASVGVKTSNQSIRKQHRAALANKAAAKKAARLAAVQKVASKRQRVSTHLARWGVHKKTQLRVTSALVFSRGRKPGTVLEKPRLKRKQVKEQEVVVNTTSFVWEEEQYAPSSWREFNPQEWYLQAQLIINKRKEEVRTACGGLTDTVVCHLEVDTMKEVQHKYAQLQKEVNRIAEAYEGVIKELASTEEGVLVLEKDWWDPFVIKELGLAHPCNWKPISQVVVDYAFSVVSRGEFKSGKEVEIEVLIEDLVSANMHIPALPDVNWSEFPEVEVTNILEFCQKLEGLGFKFSESLDKGKSKNEEKAMESKTLEIAGLDVVTSKLELVLEYKHRKPQPVINKMAIAVMAMHDGNRWVECNADIPAGAYGHSTIKYKHQDENEKDVNRVFLSCGKNIDGGPVGFVSAQQRVYEYGESKFKKGYSAFFKACRVEAEPVQPYYQPMQIVLHQYVGENLDVLPSTGVKRGTPEPISVLSRNRLRARINKGESFETDYESLWTKNLVEIANLPGLKDDEGNATRRHLFLVVADVHHQAVYAHDAKSHVRAYTGNVQVYWVHPDKLSELFSKSGHLIGLQKSYQYKEQTEPVVKEEKVMKKQIEDPVKAEQVQEPVVVENTESPRPQFSNTLLRRELEALYKSFYPYRRNEKVVVKEAELTSKIGEVLANTGLEFLKAHDSSLSFAGYDWKREDVLEMSRLMLELYSDFFPSLDASEFICIEGNKITFGNCASFYLEDEFVYDARGRAFLNVAYLDIVGKKGEEKLAGIHLCSSYGQFMYFLYVGWLPIVSKIIAAGMTNLGSNLLNFLNKSSGFKLSKDSIQNQNGGYLFLQENTFCPLVLNKVKPVTAGGKWKVFENASSLIEMYDDDDNLSPEIMREAIKMGFEKYCLDFRFDKGVFVASYVGHVHLGRAQEYAPHLFAALVERFGFKSDAEIQKALSMVITNTIKAQKGLKRVALMLAQGSEVEKSHKAGFVLMGQKKLIEGALVPVAMAPTLTFMPGIDIWVGGEDTLPVTTVTKTFSLATADFDESQPVSLVGCVGEYYAVQVENGYTFDGVYLTGKGKELVLNVCHTGSMEPIFHDSSLAGHLISVSWRIVNALKNDAKELKVEYRVATQERHPKLRGTSKAQVICADERVVYNSLNQLDGVVIHKVACQDGLKLDTTYSLLTTIGTTLMYNAGHEAVAELEKLRDECNAVLGHNGKELFITPYAVALGVYDVLMQKFEEKFGKAVWYNFAQSGELGEMVLEVQHQKALAGKGWKEINVGEVTGQNISLVLNALKQYDIKVLVDGDVKDPYTNVLMFACENGKVVRYFHRAFSFVGVEGCPVYNVELFESSTVRETIGNSMQMAAFIRAFSYTSKDNNVWREEQEDMLAEAERHILMAKLIGHMAAGVGHDLQTYSDGSTRYDAIPLLDGMEVPIHTMNKNLSIALGDKQLMLDSLEAAGVDIFNRPVVDKHFFEEVVEALSKFSFILYSEGGVKTWLWLPGLYQINKLKRSIESEYSLSNFFFSVLLKLLKGEAVESICANQLRGIVENLQKSENIVKLLGGRKNSQAKRVALPCIPTEETWVLYSGDSNSVYQQFKRDGIAVEKAREGEVVLVAGNRSPMAAGSVSRIVIVEEVNGKQFVGDRELYWNMSPVQIGVSPASVLVDGGDFDGDGHYCTPLFKIPQSECHTFEDVVRIRSTAVGKYVMGVTCEDYAADHYGIKTWKKASKTFGFSLLNTLKEEALKTGKDYADFNASAYEIQNVAVGIGYKVYMIGEHLLEIIAAVVKHGGHYVSEMTHEMRALAGEDAGALTLVVAEIYEVMLGGYSGGAAEIWAKCLKPMLSENVKLTEANRAAVKAAVVAQIGENPQVDNVVTLVELVRQVLEIEKEGITETDTAERTLVSFIFSAALCTFELGRGRFKGFRGFLRKEVNSNAGKGHRQALSYCLEWFKQEMTLWQDEEGNALNSPEVANEFTNASLVLRSLRLILRHLSLELTSGHANPFTADQLKKLTGFELEIEDEDSDEDEDEDNDEGGLGVDDEPNDGDGGDNGGSELSEPPMETIVVNGSTYMVDPCVAQQIAELLKAQMSKAEPSVPCVEPEEIEDSVPWVEAEEVEAPAEYGLNNDQQKVFNAVMAGHSIVLNGKGGTGKSHTIKAIVSEYKKLGHKVAVSAISGVAAIEIEGVTFNSLFGLLNGFGSKDKEGKYSKPTAELENEIFARSLASRSVANLFKLKKDQRLLIVVDEVFMADGRLLSICQKVAKHYGVKVQWLYSGDILQLSPPDGSWITQTAVLETADRRKINIPSPIEGLKVFKLEKNMRSGGDVEFSADLDKLRVGKMPGKSIFERIVTDEAALPEKAIHAFGTNRLVDEHNRKKLAELLGNGAKSKVYKARVFDRGRAITTVDGMNQISWVKDLLPIQPEMTICVGMPVMTRMNLKRDVVIMKKEVVKVKSGHNVVANGTVGYVVDVLDKSIVIELDNGNVVEIPYMSLNVPIGADGEPIGKYEQLPLHPAFACTFHKLQGLTLDGDLVVHPYTAWNGRFSALRGSGYQGALYVACSRNRVREKLHIYSPMGATLFAESVSANLHALEWFESQSSSNEKSSSADEGFQS